VSNVFARHLARGLQPIFITTFKERFGDWWWWFIHAFLWLKSRSNTNAARGKTI